MRLLLQLGFFFYFFIASFTRGAKAQTLLQACPLDIERLDFTGINETCSDPNDRNLCTSCPLTIVQKIVDGGYSVEEINALPIERCLLENLPQLLENGATLLAFLALQSCDFTSGNLATEILNNVTFPPPFPGLPTEWLRNEENETMPSLSPSSSSSPDDGGDDQQDDASVVAKTNGPTSSEEGGKEEEEKLSSSAAAVANSVASSSTRRVLISCVVSVLVLLATTTMT